MLPQTSVYTPIIEAIMNSIQAIHDKKEPKWKIEIEIIRDRLVRQWDVFNQDKPDIADITGFRIKDNGIWFNEDNMSSRKTILSKYKSSNGGKWLWRFSYLQHFDNVSIIVIIRGKKIL
jgi:hypothetical protein